MTLFYYPNSNHILNNNNTLIINEKIAAWKCSFHGSPFLLVPSSLFPPQLHCRWQPCRQPFLFPLGRWERIIHSEALYSTTQPVYIFTKFKINQTRLINRNSNSFFLLKHLTQFNINFDFSNYFLKKNNNIYSKENPNKVYRYKILNVLLHGKYFQIKSVNNIKKLYFYRCIFKKTSVSFFQQSKVIYHFLELEKFFSKKVIFNMNYAFITILNFLKLKVLKNLKVTYAIFYFSKSVQNKKKFSFKLILNNYIKNLIINCLLKLINIYFYSSFNNLIVNTKNYLVKKILIRNSNKPLSIIINFNNFYNRFFNIYFILLNYYFFVPNLSNQICDNLVKNLILRTLNYTVLIKKKNYNFDNSKEFKKNIIYTLAAWDNSTSGVLFVPYPKGEDHLHGRWRLCSHVNSTMQPVILNKSSKINQQTSLINKLLLIIKKKHNNKSNSWVLNKYLFKTFYKLLFIKTEYQHFNKVYNNFNMQKLTFFKKKKSVLKLKKKSNNYCFKNILVKNMLFLTYYLHFI